MSAYDLAIRWLIVSSAALLAWALIELAWEHIMTDPNNAQRRDWFSSQFERLADGHEAAYAAVTFGRYKPACRCGCINEDDPALLIHPTWFEALDDARSIIAGTIHGPAASQEAS